MQNAAFLSDLKSLSICSHDAAIGLVKPSKESSSPSTHPASDPELQRANELVSLHYNVKLKYLESGPDPEFTQAADAVNRVVSALNRL